MKDPNQITHVMVKNRKGFMYGIPLDRFRELLFPPIPAVEERNEALPLAETETAADQKDRQQLAAEATLTFPEQVTVTGE